MPCCGQKQSAGKPAAHQPTSVPSQWPLWARVITRLKSPEDAGVGDTVARLIGEVNSDQFKHWHRRTFGVDCGCDERQQHWNLLYPY